MARVSVGRSMVTVVVSLGTARNGISVLFTRIVATVGNIALALT